VLKEAYRVLYRMDLTLTDALQRLQELERDSEDVMQLRAFVAARQRSIVR
jgi:acyl-[acyl carrier protein]--UDP-N-acetylglucosamine O-acyltransferase